MSDLLGSNTIPLRPMLTGAVNNKMRSALFCVRVSVALAMLFTLNAHAHAQQASVDTGTHPFGTYSGAHDNISIVSGNLNFCIPLVYTQGAYSHDLSIPLCYNSQFVQQVTSGGQTEITPVPSFFPWVWGSNTPHLGPGWTLLGRPVTTVGPTGYPALYMPNGTVYPHPLPYSGSYGMFPNSPNIQWGSGWIYQSDGTRSTDTYNGSTTPATTTEVYDKDNTLITFTPSSITDTVGRTISVTASDATGNTPANITFHFPDSTGTARAVIVQMASMSFACATGTGQVGAGGPWAMPTSILLPNGLTYTFQYDNCGELTKITYPSGGYTRYGYTNQTTVAESSGGSLVYWTQPEVTSKSVCSASTGTPGALTSGLGNSCPINEETTRFNPISNSSQPNNSSNTVADPFGNTTSYIFSVEPTRLEQFGTYETSRRYADASGTLLKTVDTTYNNYSNTSTDVPIVPASETTTLDNGLQKQTQWTYDLRNNNFFDVPLLETREYDFGQGSPGPLIRRTDYGWWQLDNAAAFGVGTYSTEPQSHILNLKTSEAVFDGAGTKVYQIKYEYDGGSPPTPASRGDLTKTSVWRNTDGLWLNTTSSWGTGGVSSTSDENGHTTFFDYTDNYADSINRHSGAFATTITHPATAGVSHVETRSYYWGSGLLAASCGQNFSGTCKPGLTAAADYAQYTYDSMGRLIQSSTGDGGARGNCYTDDASGSCYSASFPLRVLSSTQLNPSVAMSTAKTLDGLERVITTISNSDSDCPSGYITDTGYDLDERLATESTAYCSKSDPSYDVKSSSYDGLSRISYISHIDGSYQQNKYAGRAVQSFDEGNGVRKVSRIAQSDALGRLRSVCEVSTANESGASGVPANCGLDIGGTGFLTAYQYDLLDNLSAIVQNGVSRNLNHDSLSRLVSTNNPESGTLVYTYDLAGNVISITDANGLSTTHTYDELNRLLSTSYSDGSTPSACLAYDSGSVRGNGRLVAQWTQAGACPSSPGTGTLTERLFPNYDNLGRILTDQQCATLGNCSAQSVNSVNYTYNFAGDITSSSNGLVGASSMTFYDGYTQTEHPLSVVAQQSALSPVTLFLSSGYTASGGLTDVTLGAGISVHRSFNSRQHQLSEIDTVLTTPGSASIAIAGAEQVSAYSVGSITFTGTEQTATNGGQQMFDYGNFVIKVGDATYQVGYGPNDTISTLASNVANEFQCSGGLVGATANGGTVSFTSCAAGIKNEYSLNPYADGHVSSFAQYSFAVTASGPTMKQIPAGTSAPAKPTSIQETSSGPGSPMVVTFYGNEEQKGSGNGITYDSGSFYFAVGQSGANGPPIVNMGISYSQVSNVSSLAAALNNAFSPCTTSGTKVSASVSAMGQVTITPCLPGNFYVYGTLNGSDTNNFPTPSFSLFPSSPPTPTIPVGTYDSGIATLSLNGSALVSVSYGASSTSSSLVASMVAANPSQSPVSLSASGSTLSMTTVSSANNSASYGFTISNNNGVFAQPSFTASSSSGSLAGSQNAPLYSYAIQSYAPNGNVLAVTDSVNGTWQYTYDDMNRLSTAQATDGSKAGLGVNWTYDPFGNRWTQTATGSSASTITQTSLSFSNDNRVVGYTYDATGDLKSDGIHTFGYDGAHRLVSVDGKVLYVYDASGARIAKLANGSVATLYILGLNGEHITVVDGSNNWILSNVYVPGGRLFATFTAATHLYHFHVADWLGTKRLQANQSGNQEQVCTSNPFGDGLECSGVADANDEHFTGKDHDAESGLDYFGARHLSTSLGRFMSPDWTARPSSVPYANFAYPQSLNQYAYVGNNPLKVVDSDGHCGGIANTADNACGEANARALALDQEMSEINASNSSWARLGSFQDDIPGGYLTWIDLPVAGQAYIAQDLTATAMSLNMVPIEVLQRPLRALHGVLFLAGHTAIRDETGGNQWEVLGDDGKGGGNGANQQVHNTFNKPRAATDDSPYTVWLSSTQYSALKDGANAFLNSNNPCPSCTPSYVTTHFNSNSFVYNMLFQNPAGSIRPPSAQLLLPGYGPRIGAWY